jgi:hypothetical protein
MHPAERVFGLSIRDWVLPSLLPYAAICAKIAGGAAGSGATFARNSLRTNRGGRS